MNTRAVYLILPFILVLVIAGSLLTGKALSADSDNVHNDSFSLTHYEREHLRLVTEQNRLLQERNRLLQEKNRLIERQIRECR